MTSRQTPKPWKILTALVLLMAIPRWYASGEPLEMDLSLYSVFARELLAGRSLYSDLWEMRPPGAFLTVLAAQLVAGYGTGSIFLLAMVSSTLTLVGVYYAASLGGRDKKAGLWAAGFWAVVSADVFMQADHPNVEAFINPCLVWAFALIIKAEGHEKDWGRWLGIGSLFAWASLYKHIAFFFAAAMALGHLVFPPEGQSRQQSFLQIALMAAVGFTAWGLTGLYFFLSGTFSDFWDAVFVFSRFYAGGMLQNLWTGLSIHVLIPKHVTFVLPLIIIALLGLGLVRRWTPLTRTGALFLAYVISAYIMVSIPGKFFPHYYQYWLPVLSIGAAWTLNEFQKMRFNKSHILQRMGTFVLSTLLALQAFYFQFSPEGWSQLKYRNRFLYMQETAKKIDRLLLSDETFYVWGFDPGLFFNTKRRPVTGVNDHVPLFEGPLTKKLSARERKQLAQNMPELLVVTPIRGKRHPLYQWMDKRYSPFPDQKAFIPYEFYYLKGGALEQRVRNTLKIIPSPDLVDGSAVDLKS